MARVAERGLRPAALLAALAGLGWPLPAAAGGKPFCCTAAPDESDICGTCWESAMAHEENWCGESKERCDGCGKVWCEGAVSTTTTAKPKVRKLERPPSNASNASKDASNASSASNASTEDCEADCVKDNLSYSCQDRIVWARWNLYKEEDDACAHAHELVLSECPDCAGCSMLSACPGEPTPAPLPPTKTSTTTTVPTTTSQAPTTTTKVPTTTSRAPTTTAKATTTAAPTPAPSPAPTFAPALSSCRARGCSGFDPSLPCQCADGCLEREDCCEDWESYCGLERASLQARMVKDLELRKLEAPEHKKAKGPRSADAEPGAQGFCCMASRSAGDACASCWPAAQQAAADGGCGTSQAACEANETAGGCGKTWCTLGEASKREAEGSCKDYGCGHFDRNRSCQCNTRCLVYQNCCSDFQDTCPDEAKEEPLSCFAYGCGQYRQSQPCQCGPSCEEAGDCCSDYESACARMAVSWLNGSAEERRNASDGNASDGAVSAANVTSAEVTSTANATSAANATRTANATRAANASSTANATNVSQALAAADATTKGRASKQPLLGLAAPPAASDVGEDRSPFCCMVLEVASGDCGSCWPGARAGAGSECGESEAACQACGAPLWCGGAAEELAEEVMDKFVVGLPSDGGFGAGPSGASAASVAPARLAALAAAALAACACLAAVAARRRVAAKGGLAWARLAAASPQTPLVPAAAPRDLESPWPR